MKTLERPVLVLNRNWQPVHVATVARALVLLWNDHARVVDPETYQQLEWCNWAKLTPVEGERFVQSVRQKIKLPEVITLVEYDKLPIAAVQFSRHNLFKRDKYLCQYCGGQPGMGELSIDHIVPRAQGGVSSWTNCVLSCTGCNRKKADRTPEQAGMKLRKKPVKPTWNPTYNKHNLRLDSWERFVSDAYWNVTLAE